MQGSYLYSTIYGWIPHHQQNISVSNSSIELLGNSQTGSNTKLRISCYSKVNPIPEKSAEMKNKIQIFNEEKVPRQKELVFSCEDEITCGNVSKMIATFSSSSPSIPSACDSYSRQNVSFQSQLTIAMKTKKFFSVPNQN